MPDTLFAFDPRFVTFNPALPACKTSYVWTRISLNYGMRGMICTDQFLIVLLVLSSSYYVTSPYLCCFMRLESLTRGTWAYS